LDVIFAETDCEIGLAMVLLSGAVVENVSFVVDTLCVCDINVRSSNCSIMGARSGFRLVIIPLFSDETANFRSSTRGPGDR
jgi:hypothetical protein